MAGSANTPSAQDYVQQIRSARQRSNVSEALSRLGEALSHFPGNLQLQVLEGELRAETDGIAAGREYFLALSNKYPDKAVVDVQLASIAIEEQEYEAVERHICSAVAKGLPPDRALRLQLRAARSAGDMVRALGLLQTIIDEAPEPDAGLLCQLAYMHLQLQDREAAMSAVRRALAIAPDDPTLRLCLVRVALTAGDEDLAEQEVEALLELAPEEPSGYIAALSLYQDQGRQDKVLELVGRGLEHRLDSYTLFFNAKRSLKFSDALRAKALAWAGDVDAQAPLQEQLFARELLLREGSILPRALQVGEIASSLGKTEQQCDWHALVPDSELKRPTRLEPLSAEIDIARGVGTVVIVFTGLADQAMMPITAFDRFLAATGCSAIYVYDSKRMLYNEGLESVASNYHDTIRYLRNLLQTLNCERLITIGSSGGGYGALRYGLELDAEKILCFSSPTNISAEFLKKDNRGRIVAKRLQRLPIESLDIKNTLRRASGGSDIHLFYAADHVEDLRHAQHLVEESNVTLHPLVGHDAHASLLILAGEGKLPGVLRGIGGLP